MTRQRDKPPNKRQLRVGEELRHGLVRILARAHFRDPQLIDANITVTEVRVGPDLRYATVFVVPLGGRDIEAVVGALQRAAAYLRGQLAGEVDLRNTPRITFKADRSFEHAERIEQLLHREKVSQDLVDGGADHAS